MREFSKIVQVADSKGRPVRLSHTHRFRHTKLTRLAELGLPVHVLQRYAGHATPTMAMYYVAQREEHAEQAFLATVKLKADGTRVAFSREDHDTIHLLGRADRILPNGWCLLPPLQSCGKGNACLTCSVFVTDQTHRQALERQLADTAALIDRATTDFAQRHGRPMPADNVWLAQRQAEHAALTRLLAAMQAAPGRAVQGAGCGSAAPAGPVPVTIDTAAPPEGTAMNDIRARRTAVLAAAAKAKSDAKAQAADQAIRRLIKRGEPVTFQAVQREAGVSHAFLYGNPDLRARIERLRAQARPQPAPPGDGNGDNTIIQALTSQISHLKKQHRDETQALRAALEQAHGENLQLRRELTRLGWTGQLATP